MGGVAIAAALAINTSLTVLSLRLNDIGPEGGVALASALRFNASLTELDTRRNDRISGNSAEQLSVAVLGSSSLLKFSAVPMRELRADELTVLDLSTKDLGPTEARVLGGLLVANTSLTDLNLHFNLIGDEGCVALAYALRFNASLTSLYLDDNSIGLMGGIAIGKALAVNTALTSLGVRRGGRIFGRF